MTSHSTTFTNPDHSICRRIRIRIHYESESRFGQIEYGLGLLPDSVASAIWTKAFGAWVQHANHSATEPPLNLAENNFS